MKLIPIGLNRNVEVDDSDYLWLRNWKWTFDGNYAVTKVGGRKVYMHRLINLTESGFDTDHRDRDKLNNQRSNLRSVTHQENSTNMPVSKSNTSGTTGVSWNRNARKWSAYIMRNYRKIHIGYFPNKEFAVEARQKANICLT